MPCDDSGADLFPGTPETRIVSKNVKLEPNEGSDLSLDDTIPLTAIHGSEIEHESVNHEADVEQKAGLVFPFTEKHKCNQPVVGNCEEQTMASQSVEDTIELSKSKLDISTSPVNGKAEHEGCTSYSIEFKEGYARPIQNVQMNSDYKGCTEESNLCSYDIGQNERAGFEEQIVLSNTEISSTSMDSPEPGVLNGNISRIDSEENLAADCSEFGVCLNERFNKFIFDCDAINIKTEVTQCTSSSSETLPANQIKETSNEETGDVSETKLSSPKMTKRGNPTSDPTQAAVRNKVPVRERKANEPNLGVRLTKQKSDLRTKNKVTDEPSAPEVGSTRYRYQIGNIVRMSGYKKKELASSTHSLNASISKGNHTENFRVGAIPKIKSLNTNPITMPNTSSSRRTSISGYNFNAASNSDRQRKMSSTVAENSSASRQVSQPEIRRKPPLFRHTVMRSKAKIGAVKEEVLNGDGVRSVRLNSDGPDNKQPPASVAVRTNRDLSTASADADSATNITNGGLAVFYHTATQGIAKEVPCKEDGTKLKNTAARSPLNRATLSAGRTKIPVLQQNSPNGNV